MPKRKPQVSIRAQHRAEIDMQKLMTVLLAVARQQQAAEAAREGEARDD